MSSPGFITLVYSKITNKVKFTEEVKENLKHMDKTTDEEVVSSWMTKMFHVETSLQKWGNVQVEVLSAPSTQEDASYVKYLFAEASSQNRIRKGLLGEQKEFLEKVTSFQLEGILYNDIMYNKNTS